MGQLRIRRLAAGAFVAFFWSLASAQTSDSETCTDVTVDGLSEGDGFPDESTIYTNQVDEDSDERGEYMSEDGEYYIWYSPTEPVEYTANVSAAASGSCSGYWVISKSHLGVTFTDLVWYQSSGGATCDQSPAQLGEPDDWNRSNRTCETCEAETTSASISVACSNEDDDSDDDGLSELTIVILIVVGGAVFMLIVCLGALACCLRGSNSPEEAIMPPGELTEGSIIGDKAGRSEKPGLHAHPERQGSMHPRPEDWAPSYASNTRIPQGSRSGPSVRSIGYT